MSPLVIRPRVSTAAPLRISQPERLRSACWSRWRSLPGPLDDAELYFEAQISEYSLPTRPTKKSDSRAAGFTGESVEVDAIPATTLRALVTAAIEQHIDPEALRLTREVEQSERDVLTRIVSGRSQ